MCMNHSESVNLETGTDGQSTEAHTAESEFCLPKSIRKKYDHQGPGEPLTSLPRVVCSNNHTCGTCLVGAIYINKTKMLLH